MDFTGRAQGSLRIVRKGHGRPKDGHHRISDMLVHHATVTVDDDINGGKEVVQHGMGFFRIYADDSRVNLEIPANKAVTWRRLPWLSIAVRAFAPDGLSAAIAVANLRAVPWADRVPSDHRRSEIVRRPCQFRFRRISRGISRGPVPLANAEIRLPIWCLPLTNIQF
jgi:endonuclease/exonuclease/phosphatase (EEP) superfamily protein YafD